MKGEKNSNKNKTWWVTVVNPETDEIIKGPETLEAPTEYLARIAFFEKVRKGTQFEALRFNKVKGLFKARTTPANFDVKAFLETIKGI